MPRKIPGVRKVCGQCHRAAPGCVCADLPSIDNRTEVVILQHPRERRHPWGTATLLLGALARVRVVVGLVHPPLDGVLLWPSCERPPETPPDRLIVIDGTWSGAKKIKEQNGWLEACPTWSVRSDTPRYQTRSEPMSGGLATVEAVALALSALEPTQKAALDRLLTVFEAREARLIDARRGTPRRRANRSATPLDRTLSTPEDLSVGVALQAHGALFGVALLFRGHRRVFHVVDPAVALSDDRLHRAGIDSSAEPVARAHLPARIDEVLEGAAGLFVWRAAPLLTLGLKTPVFDLKTLYRNDADSAPGAVTDVMGGDGPTRLLATLSASERLLRTVCRRRGTPRSAR